MSDRVHIKAGYPFIITPKRLILRWGSVVGPNGVAVYLALLNFADNDHACYPGERTLAQLLGLSVRTIRTTLRKLEQGGLIEIRTRFADSEQNGKPVKRQQTNEYYLQAHLPDRPRNRQGHADTCHCGDCGPYKALPIVEATPDPDPTGPAPRRHGHVDGCTCDQCAWFAQHLELHPEHEDTCEECDFFQRDRLNYARIYAEWFESQP